MLLGFDLLLKGLKVVIRLLVMTRRWLGIFAKLRYAFCS